MAKSKHKSIRNQPEMYDEIKKSCTFGLTKTAIKKLDSLSQRYGISRSELVERIARGLIKL
ncbi:MULTISPECIES: hypothetical protein [unclassified Microcoleus]|uniref:hypothetical protein n=1 Tax=unclassified Microcoleus TaxID=2642155 RepID=UPI002FD70F02